MLNLAPWQHDEKSEFQRGLTSLYDLTYLLAVVPRPDQWNSRLRTSFKAGAGKVLEVLAMMQGMDRMKRQVGQHVEMEDSGWKQTYNAVLLQQVERRELLRGDVAHDAM